MAHRARASDAGTTEPEAGAALLAVTLPWPVTFDGSKIERCSAQRYRLEATEAGDVRVWSAAGRYLEVPAETAILEYGHG